MARRLNPNSDAWGGAWGSASAWGGTWGWSWGPLHEVEEDQEYHGGGKRSGREGDAQLHRDHWDYMDSLREIQAKAAADKDRLKQVPEKAPEIVLQAAPAPVSARAMRGKVKILEHQEALPYVPGNLMVLAAMMALIDDDD